MAIGLLRERELKREGVIAGAEGGEGSGGIGRGVANLLRKLVLRRVQLHLLVVEEVELLVLMMMMVERKQVGEVVLRMVVMRLFVRIEVGSHEELGGSWKARRGREGGEGRSWIEGRECEEEEGRS